MENLNLKAGALAIILITFTYQYYVREPGSIMSPGVVVILGFAVIAMFLAYFFGVKILGYLLSNYIYPNIALNVLLPFVVLSFFTWLIYGASQVKPFVLDSDFFTILKYFGTQHLQFIALSTLGTCLALSFPAQKDRIVGDHLLRNNLIFLFAFIFASAISVYAFYNSNKIRQASTTFKEDPYATLEELKSTAGYDVKPLLSARQSNYAEKPYVLPNKNELIIVTVYAGSNNENPVENIYRLNKEGDIIEQIDAYDLEDSSVNFFPIVFRDGLLTSDKGEEFITWVFDGHKERQDAKKLKQQKDWKIEGVKENSTDLKMVHFKNTSVFNCNNLNDVKYNGNKYFDLAYQKEVIKLKIDTVYGHTDNIQNCNEKKLEYYKFDQFNFSLLRLNEDTYYIIKPKKK